MYEQINQSINNHFARPGCHVNAFSSNCPDPTELNLRSTRQECVISHGTPGNNFEKYISQNFPLSPYLPYTESTLKLIHPAPDTASRAHPELPSPFSSSGVLSEHAVSSKSRNTTLGLVPATLALNAPGALYSPSGNRLTLWQPVPGEEA